MNTLTQQFPTILKFFLLFLAFQLMTLINDLDSQFLEIKIESLFFF